MTSESPPPGTDAALAGVLEGLFRGARERFVADRNAAAQHLRATGHREAAAWLRALPKPTLSAWVVNQLWWTAPADVGALVEASRTLAGALRGGGGPAAQGAATQARRRALEGLEAKAEALLAGAGHAATPAALRRVGATLEALATHVALGTGAAAALGRLCEDLEPPALEQLIGLGAGLEPEAPPAGASATEGSTSRLAERERDEAQARVDAAAAALDQARRAADDATLAAERAADEHRRAHALAESARQRADEAERAALRLGAEARRLHERVAAARDALAGHAAALEHKTAAWLRARSGER